MLIFRFTPRGLTRLRLEVTRSGRISRRIASGRAFLRRGGNSDKAGHAPLDHADGVREGEPVGVFISSQRRFVHQAADSKVRHEQAVEFLPHQLRGLAAQNDLRTAQMSLQFVQSGLSGKGLARC